MIKVLDKDRISLNTRKYFEKLNKQLEEIYTIATLARRKGKDPTLTVEIPIAKDIADRVEGLIGPPGVGERIRELEEKGYSREKVAFEIAKEICEGKFFDADKETIAEQAVRTALAIITESITAAPIEGIAKVKIKKNDDGTEYLAVYYAGPIRSAGGTAAGMSVLLADYVRKKLGLARYKPTEKEVERYLEEIELYDKVVHLQLPTTRQEQKFAAQNIPIEITGEPTNDVEVSGNRDLPRVETNKLRGGACLVFNDGVVGRAKKLLKRINEINLEGWEWIKKLVELHDKRESKPDGMEVSDKYEDENIPADIGYIKDVIAGRPVFAHPSQKGGLRIRYGRSRNTGLAAMGIHPALMAISNDFLACGTHVRTERPGKGAIVMPVDSIHPPIVKLKNGDVIKVKSYDYAKKIKDEVEEVLFLGDMLYGVGEFNQNNYNLVPSGYCEEWWAQELEKALVETDIEDYTNALNIDESRLYSFINDPISIIPTPEEAISLSILLKIPLHPEYTYHWHDISKEDYVTLRKFVFNNLTDEGKKLGYIPLESHIKRILENICIPHKVVKDKIFFGKHWKPFLITLGINKERLLEIDPKKTKVVEIINSIGLITIREKVPIYTGARMGRPEKAKDRRMKPPVHLLFPVGEKGGRQRDLLAAANEENITVELVRRKCKKCGVHTFKTLCDKCNEETEIIRYCPKCKKEVDEDICPQCKLKTVSYMETKVPLKTMLHQAQKILGIQLPKKIKAVKKLMNSKRICESLEKGILRAKYDLYVYRDGTLRFDSTDAVLTHFKPKEIGASVETLRKCGYNFDIDGKPLMRSDQILEIKIQDVIINEKGGEYLLRVSQFIDDLLEKVYKMPRYYNAKRKEDLIGHLIIGLAPHTSAGILGRLIGFTKAKVNFAHPYWQAAKRRNCLASNEEIQIWDIRKQSLILKPIGEIVEELINNGANKKIVDDYGTLAIENPYPNWRVVSIDEKAKTPILQPIKHWIKGESNYWIKIRTESGRTLKVTPDHTMLIWNKETKTISKTKAQLLNKGDHIPIIKSMPLPTITPPARLNILKVLSENLPQTDKFSKFKHQVRLRNAEKWMKKKIFSYIQKKFGIKGPLTRLRAEYRQHLTNMVPSEPIKEPFSHNWYKSIPLSHLEILHKKGIFEWDEIPESAKLGMAKDNHTVSPYIPFNTDLMRLIGYIISEGYIRDEKSCYQINISVPNDDIRTHVKALIKELLGASPYLKEDNKQLIHTGRIHAYLFAYALGIGKNALNKRIPKFIFTLPEEYKYSFISAIIDGDGSIIEQANRTTIYTANYKLAQDYSLLLLSLGIFARVAKVEGGRYGKTVLERYKKLGIKPKCNNPLYHINIIGKENGQLFENIKLAHKKKNERINAILKKGLPKFKKLGEINEKVILDKISEISIIKSKASSYCLEVDSINNNSQPYHNITTIYSIVVGQCDGDEDSIFLALDAFINFSKYYLPDIRGGKMDAPLILVSNINPNEVDDESHNVDTGSRYPLALYEATLKMKSPKDILPLIDLVSNRLHDATAYEGFRYTHETSNIFVGAESTLYKKLNKMDEKVEAQLYVAKKIRAVKIDDVAHRIIINHFIPDIIGNLRRFGSQKFRCTNCNKTYRRIPLSGKCEHCGSESINLTVFMRSITKYYEIANELVKKYQLSEYLKNRLDIIKHNVSSLFTGENIKIGEDPTTEKNKKKVRLSDFII